MSIKQTVELIRQRRALGITTRRGKLPRAQLPASIQLEYFKALRPYVDLAHDMVKAELYPDLPRVLADAARAREAHTDAVDLNTRIDRLAAKFYDQFHPRQIEDIAAKFGARTAAFQGEQLGRQVRAAFGVDLDAVMTGNIKGRMEGFITSNVSLVKSVSERYFVELENRVTGAVRSGQRWESLAKDLEERYDIATDRAKVIARDQVGKFYGELNQARQQNLGVTSYIWQTSNDNRVRDEHDVRQGVYFQWDSPPVDGHPGEPILCRCYAEPDLSNIFEALRS